MIMLGRADACRRPIGFTLSESMVGQAIETQDSNLSHKITPLFYNPNLPFCPLVQLTEASPSGYCGIMT